MRINSGLLKVLADAAEEAGAEVMRIYRTEGWAATLKADLSPLTEADLRADAVIARALHREYPAVPVISEEKPALAPPSTIFYFLVDPLDGTKEFLKRNDEFTVNIAVVDRGLPAAGVVFAPALGEMFIGARGFGAFKRKCGLTQAIQTRPPSPGETLRIIGSRSHATVELAQWLAQLEGSHTFVPAGSSLKFCRVAEGAAHVYPRVSPTNQWDTAAGQAVLEAAGGAVLVKDSSDLRYGMNRPMLNPSFIAVADRNLLMPRIP